MFGNINKETKEHLLYLMLKIRRFEEKITEVYPEQEIRTPVHLCIGQEAIAAGVCANLNSDDFMFSTHRNHGHCIAKGIDIKLLMAELYGKITGCSSGKGGSMHLASVEHGIMGTSAIVGGGIALAVGTALSSKMKNEKKVSVTFFGDGAVDEGIFYESLNFASLKKLPVIFVCENNFYATNSPQSARQVQDNISRRGEIHCILGFQVDGNDVMSIYSLAAEAIRKARSGLGPTLIECRTYRWRGHVGPNCDYDNGCRQEGELHEWMNKCPIEVYKEYLLNNQIITLPRFEEMIDRVDSEIESALAFAKGSPFPGKDELFRDVYYERGL